MKKTVLLVVDVQTALILYGMHDAEKVTDNINSLIKICDIENLDLIITDSKLDENILKKYLENGIKIINR